MAATKAAAKTPQFAVIDDVIHYTTKAGIELTLDLDIPADALKKAIGSDDEDRSEEAQFEIIAEIFGDNFQVAYEKMGALERRRLLRSFFVEFHKAASMPLGESLGSSDS